MRTYTLYKIMFSYKTYVSIKNFKDLKILSITINPILIKCRVKSRLYKILYTNIHHF